MQLLDLEENPLGSFTSLREAADAVDTNHMLLSRYAKSTDTVFLDFLGIKVDIYCQGFTKEGHVIHPASKVYAPLVHDIILPEDVICVLDSSLTRVLATYSSMYVASQTLGIDRKKIRRYIGTQYLLNAPWGSVYFDAAKVTLCKILTRVTNPAKPIFAHNLITMVTTHYSSVNQAAKGTGIQHTFIPKHLSLNTTFVSLDRTVRYKFTSG